MWGIRISKTAQRDLDRIWHYVEIDSGVERADLLLADIGEAIRLAGTFPGGGSDRSQFRRRMRSYAAGNYLVFFKKSGKFVQIVRVIHGARNLMSIFQPKKKRRP